MKHFKSILSLLLVAVLGCSMILNTSAQTQNPFSDVSAGSWYYDDVQKANSEGIMIGTADDKFDPDAVVTREMFVTALERICDISWSYRYQSNKFKDVKYDEWYTYPVLWASRMGITLGIDDTTFGLGKPVTREQIATFIYRYLNNEYITISLQDSASPAPSFSDTPSEYAKDAVELMRKTGIVNGVGNNKFAPGATATRAQVAAILCRLSEAFNSATYKFNLDASKISAIEVRHQIPDENGETPKTKIISDREVVTREIETINATPITSSHKVEPTVGWTYDISFLGEKGNAIIGFMIWEGGFKQSTRFFESVCFEKYIGYINS